MRRDISMAIAGPLSAGLATFSAHWNDYSRYSAALDHVSSASPAFTIGFHGTVTFAENSRVLYAVISQQDSTHMLGIAHLCGSSLLACACGTLPYDETEDIRTLCVCLHCVAMAANAQHAPRRCERGDITVEGPAIFSLA